MGTEETWCGREDNAPDPGRNSTFRSRVHVGEGYTEELEVKVGVHKGSALSRLLFINVLRALSCEFRSCELVG